MVKETEPKTSAIQVEVTFCAWPDNTFGEARSSVTFQESLETGATFTDLVHQLASRYPALPNTIIDVSRQQLYGDIVVIVNGKFLEMVGGLPARLADGDKVQLLPCVPGG
ncbi:MAG: MoaD/ThiS family protein [Chloroflexota bacterium]